MGKYLKLMIFCLLLPVLLLLSAGRRPSHTAPNTDGFALVELFTSEGCSSCPPADDLVATLPKRYPAGVYVLSFHVDYWDRLGWKDAFSKADYTLRQKKYSEVLQLQSIYTPQVIINGKTEMVGSDETRLRQAIDEQLAHAVNAAIEASAHNADAKTITVDYTVPGKSQGAFHAALIQMQASTAVKNGENAGKQLHHADIVRDLKSSGKTKGSLTLSLPAGVTAADCKVVVFLQDKENLQVGGARLLDIR